MKTTIIRTSEPARFAAVTAASGIGISPFMLDAPSCKRVESTAFGPGRMPVILCRGTMNRGMPRLVVLPGGAPDGARSPAAGHGRPRRIRSA